MLFMFAIGAVFVALVGSRLSVKSVPKAAEPVYCTLEAQAVYGENGEILGLDRDSVRPKCSAPATPAPAKEEKQSRTRRN